jgi:hypothetical protein
VAYWPSPAVRRYHHHVTRSARRLRVDPTVGIGREVAGGGMAAAGFGFPEDGARTSAAGRDSTGVFEPPAASHSPALLSRRETLPVGLILGLPGPINEKPSEQAGSRPSGRTEPGIPADGAKNGADAGARSGAGKRALLGRGHIRASNKRHSDGREQQ